MKWVSQHLVWGIMILTLIGLQFNDSGIIFWINKLNQNFFPYFLQNKLHITSKLTITLNIINVRKTSFRSCLFALLPLLDMGMFSSWTKICSYPLYFNHKSHDSKSYVQSFLTFCTNFVYSQILITRMEISKQIPPEIRCSIYVVASKSTY